MYEKKKFSQLYLVCSLNRYHSITLSLFSPIDYRTFYSMNKNLHLFNHKHNTPYFYLCHNPYGISIGTIDTCIESLRNACKVLLKSYRWHSTILQKQNDINHLQEDNSKINSIVTGSNCHDLIEVSLRQLIGLNNQKLKKRLHVCNNIMNEHTAVYNEIRTNQLFFLEKFLSLLAINEHNQNIINSYILNMQLSLFDFNTIELDE